MSRLRVLLFNDNAKRDLLGLRLLEIALQKRGVRTQLCNPMNAKIKLRSFRPHAFIAARGDAKIARDASGACKVYVVPGEGGQQTKETILSVFMGRGYWRLDAVDWISRCYLWNDSTREWLLETGMFSNDQLMVVGNTRLDIYRTPALLRSIREDSGGGFRLGVAFSAKSTSTYAGHPRFAQVYYDMHRDMTFPITAEGGHFEDVVWRDHAILRRMMRNIRYYLETTDGQLWLRPSPFESPREYRFLEQLYPGRVRVWPNQTLPEFLSGVDALLTCWSTTGLEALLLGIPIISIAETIDQERLFQHISARASGFETYTPFYHMPRSEEELFTLIDRAREKKLGMSPRPDEEVSRLLHEIYNWPGATPTADLIADDLIGDLAGQSESDNSAWRESLPLRYNLPLLAARLAAPLRAFSVLARSGDFKTYRDFLRTTDPGVESLLKRASISAG